MSTITTAGRSITYAEGARSPSIKVNDRGVTAVRRFYLPTWDDCPYFAAALMGNHTVSFTATEAKVEYDVPRLALPNYPQCHVSGVSIDPYDPNAPDSQAGVDLLKSTSMNTYRGGGVVTATYDTLFSSNPQVVCNRFSGSLLLNAKGTFITYSGNGGAEIMMTEQGEFHWESDSADPVGLGLHPGIVIPTTQHVITWQPVIAPPWKNISKQLGKVDAGSPGLLTDCPSGNLLFVDYSWEQLPRFQTGQNRQNCYYKLTYRFAEQSKFLNDADAQPVGWNYLYKKTASGEGWRIIRDHNTNPPYRNGSFISSLFNYGL